MRECASGLQRDDPHLTMSSRFFLLFSTFHALRDASLCSADFFTARYSRDFTRVTRGANKRLIDGQRRSRAERVTTTFAYRLNSENKVKVTAVPLHASNQAELAWLVSAWMLRRRCAARTRRANKFISTVVLSVGYSLRPSNLAFIRPLVPFQGA